MRGLGRRQIPDKRSTAPASKGLVLLGVRGVVGRFRARFFTYQREDRDAKEVKKYPAQSEREGGLSHPC